MPCWTFNQGVALCDAGAPDAPCVRLRLFGEIQQAFESPGYGTLYVTANARQTTCPTNTVYIQLCLESAQYGRMCQAWPLPYGGGSEYTAQYDHMPSGPYTMYVRYYGVGCFSGEIVLTGAGAFWAAGAEPQETATPRPTPTRLVPPSPTPRAVINTPVGSSNLDTIINEGMLTIGRVGRVFEWLWSLATWLFSGAWRGGGGEMR
jgi:hypothetical protein